MTTKVNDVRDVLIRGARAEAVEDGSATIEAEHVLLALTELSGTTTARLLAEAGLTHETTRAALDREWEQSLSVAGVAVAIAELPKATPDRSRSPQIGEATKLLLKRAMATASATGGGRIGAAHLLVGALDTNLGRIPRALDLAGIDRKALRTQAYEAATRRDH
ncbi:Clp protease N-terminal domain-containing protein [Streptomyces sp. SID13031]|uniref:Clp protease N-terminal domain-containing protein n=1 Tax=Streptomyces sp. SID13031 TaxID=2706046 RepID=UPI0013CAAB9B|nr:Clp protease N-terminal domain-containing protein [Streptomyces sp. SID13031]NEA34204.1 Clp protease [Streptomyces sp. SID13031]